MSSGNWGGSTTVVSADSKHPKEATLFASSSTPTSRASDRWTQSRARSSIPPSPSALDLPSVNAAVPFYGNQDINQVFHDASSYVDISFQWGPTMVRSSLIGKTAPATPSTARRRSPRSLDAVQQSTIAAMKKQGFSVQLVSRYRTSEAAALMAMLGGAVLYRMTEGATTTERTSPIMAVTTTPRAPAAASPARRTRRLRRGWATPYLFILPFGVLFILFFIVPILYAIDQSFYKTQRSGLGWGRRRPRSTAWRTITTSSRTAPSTPVSGACCSSGSCRCPSCWAWRWSWPC